MNSEIALTGRSNVENQSLSTPCLIVSLKLVPLENQENTTTQFLLILMTRLRFVDVPGWLCRCFKKEREKWGRMIEYLTTRENLQAVVSLVDLRHEPTADDVQMYGFLKELL